MGFIKITLPEAGGVLYAADMAQSNGNISDGISRYTVPEAAKVLGISPEAVRNRLSRGTLDSVKENGSVFVLLKTDTSRHADGTPEDISGESGGLISAKDETIRVLREQLEAEREANRENRRIIAGLVQRVPEIEAPRKAPESPRTSAEESGNQEGQATSGGAQEATESPDRRSWWRRWFGL